jgi:hypothetical protein
MSASTEVEQIIEARLSELEEQLRPLADLEREKTRLERALEVLREGASRNSDVGPSGRAARSSRATTPTPKPARRGRGRRTANRGSRAKRGSNLEAILDHVREHPGATATDLASATGISRGVVYSAVSRLAAGGRLRREQLPDGQVAYHLPS